MTEKELEQAEWVIGYLSEGQASLTGEEVLMLHKLIERVKELNEDYDRLAHDYDEELHENKRYREALKEIASDDSWETVDEVRSIAYVALESE